MKAFCLERGLQQFINALVTEKYESDEMGLGFDAMLSQDVVNFLTTEHSVSKPLMPRVLFSQEAICALDEYELAMV